jgi:hypothetical protein
MAVAFVGQMGSHTAAGGHVIQPDIQIHALTQFHDFHNGMIPVRQQRMARRVMAQPCRDQCRA